MIFLKQNTCSRWALFGYFFLFTTLYYSESQKLKFLCVHKCIWEARNPKSFELILICFELSKSNDSEP